MAVSYINSTPVTLTQGGTYVVDTSGSVVALTLPALSAVGSDGMVIKIVRDGASNAVTVTRAGSDEYWDATTSRSLDDDNSAVSLVARDSGSVWYETGRYRTVT